MFGRKADVGDLVHIAELGHHAFAYGLCWDFAFVLRVEFFFDQLGEFDFDIFGDRSLAAGVGDASHDVLSGEWDTRAVAFDDHQSPGGFDAFIGGISAFALKAMASTTDDRPAFGRAGIDDFVLVVAAEWADHVKTPPVRELYQGRYDFAREAAIGHDIGDLFEAFEHCRVF